MLCLRMMRIVRHQRLWHTTGTSILQFNRLDIKHYILTYCTNSLMLRASRLSASEPAARSQTNDNAQLRGSFWMIRFQFTSAPSNYAVQCGLLTVYCMLFGFIYNLLLNTNRNRFKLKCKRRPQLLLCRH